jgi:hypothetical protein
LIEGKATAQPSPRGRTHTDFGPVPSLFRANCTVEAPGLGTNCAAATPMAFGAARAGT